MAKDGRLTEQEQAALEYMEAWGGLAPLTEFKFGMTALKTIWRKGGHHGDPPWVDWRALCSPETETHYDTLAQAILRAISKLEQQNALLLLVIDQREHENQGLREERGKLLGMIKQREERIATRLMLKANQINEEADNGGRELQAGE